MGRRRRRENDEREREEVDLAAAMDDDEVKERGWRKEVRVRLPVVVKKVREREMMRGEAIVARASAENPRESERRERERGVKMEGAMGPTTSSSHSRPLRSSSRFYFNNNGNGNGNGNVNHFTGPVRRWEKKWVHVSSSLPSTLKRRKQSNGPKPDKSSLLLCKWTPLSAADKTSGELPRRKFRYTPIAVMEDEKKLAAKRVVDDDKSGEMHQRAKRLAIAMDSDDIYGMLDINHDQIGEHQEAGKCILTQYSQRSHMDVRLFSENHNKDSHSLQI